jgi:hypothetical protein
MEPRNTATPAAPKNNGVCFKLDNKYDLRPLTDYHFEEVVEKYATMFSSVTVFKDVYRK